MPQTFHNVLLHAIFSTKERAPLISPALRPRLHEYMAGIINNNIGVPIYVGGTQDHVHILLCVLPPVAISDAMRTLKACSSKWVHETFGDLKSFAWQDGFAVFSVSESNKQQVVRYIEEQEEHHRKLDFKEELLLFLKRNHVDYDPRFVWT